MLSKIKDFVKKKESDLVVILGLVLVAVASFGAGYLIAPRAVKSPIIIENNQAAIMPQNSQNQALESDISISLKTPEKGLFVGSAKSDKYHWPQCPFAQKISPQNQVWFNSESEAQKAGYKRCSNFDQYAPQGYIPQ
jgi:hypothetical protein